MLSRQSLAGRDSQPDPWCHRETWNWAGVGRSALKAPPMSAAPVCSQGWGAGCPREMPGDAAGTWVSRGCAHWDVPQLLAPLSAPGREAAAHS